VPRHEFFNYVVDSCLSDLNRGALNQGIAKIIEWGRPSGAQGTVAGGLRSLASELWRACMEHSRDGDIVPLAKLQSLTDTISSTWGDRALESLLGSTRQQLDEPLFTRFVSGVLQRTGDQLEGRDRKFEAADVQRALGLRQGARSGQYSREQFNAAVVDACLSERDSYGGVAGVLSRLVASTTSTPPGGREPSGETRWQGDAESRRELERLFERMDREGRGYLDSAALGDFHKLLRSCWDLSGEDVLLSLLSGHSVSKEDFVQFMGDLINRAFERLGNGKHFVGEYDMRELARAFPHHDSRDLVQSMDRDGDRQVSKEEFFGFVVRDCLRDIAWGDFNHKGLRKIIELAGRRHGGGEANLRGIEEEIQRLFETLDKDNSNSVDRFELGQLGEMIKTGWGLASTDDVMQKITNYSGAREINRFDFSDFLMRILRKAFNHLDSDGNGFIDYRELQELSSHFRESNRDLYEKLSTSASRYEQTRKVRYYDFVAFVVEELLRGAGWNQYRPGMQRIIELGAPRDRRRRGSLAAREPARTEPIRGFEFDDSNQNRREPSPRGRQPSPRGSVAFDFDQPSPRGRQPSPRGSSAFNFEDDSRAPPPARPRSPRGPEPSAIEEFDFEKEAESIGRRSPRASPRASPRVDMTGNFDFEGGDDLAATGASVFTFDSDI